MLIFRIIMIIVNTEIDGDNRILKDAKIAVSLNYQNNFWSSLEMPLINCKVDWNLSGQRAAFCLQMVMIVMMLILKYYLYYQRRTD